MADPLAKKITYLRADVREAQRVSRELDSTIRGTQTRTLEHNAQVAEDVNSIIRELRGSIRDVTEYQDQIRQMRNPNDRQILRDAQHELENLQALSARWHRIPVVQGGRRKSKTRKTKKAGRRHRRTRK